MRSWTQCWGQFIYFFYPLQESHKVIFLSILEIRKLGLEEVIQFSQGS